jgi:hypothetical protein
LGTLIESHERLYVHIIHILCKSIYLVSRWPFRLRTHLEICQ